MMKVSGVISTRGLLQLNLDYPNLWWYFCSHSWCCKF